MNGVLNADSLYVYPLVTLIAQSDDASRKWAYYMYIVCLVFKVLLDVSRKMFYDGISRSGSSLRHHRLILGSSRITRTYQNLPELTRTYQNLPELTRIPELIKRYEI